MTTPSTGRVAAIVPAAGRGTRLGEPIPKAFVPVRGRSLLERCVQGLITAEVCDDIVVVVSPDMEANAEAVLRHAGILQRVIIVHGGAERSDSVRAGLQAVPDAEFVLVHDAARALTPPGMIARVAAALTSRRNPTPQAERAVIPALPVADTIKTIATDAAGEFVADTPQRSQLRAVQTPQGFSVALLQSAHASSADATDDAALVEALGYRVQIVAGDPMAFKVTTPLDLLLAEAVTGAAEPTIFTVPDA